MSPSWQMALLEADRFSAFLAEAAKVICHMAPRPDFELRNTVQLVHYTSDVGHDGLVCNYAGLMACHMLNWNWLSVANLVGYEKDYDQLKPHFDSVAAWDMASIISFLFNNNTERAMLAFYRMRNRLGHDTQGFAIKAASRKTSQDTLQCFGTLSSQEASYHGIFTARMLAISQIASFYEQALEPSTLTHKSTADERSVRKQTA